MLFENQAVYLEWTAKRSDLCNFDISRDRIDKPGPRTFAFSESELPYVKEMIEELLVNRIAVANGGKPHSLFFSRKCQRNDFPYIPPQLQLKVDMTTDLPLFLESVELNSN